MGLYTCNYIPCNITSLTLPVSRPGLLIFLTCLSPCKAGNKVFCPKIFFECFHLSNSISKHKEFLKPGSYCKCPIFQIIQSFSQTQNTPSSFQFLFPLSHSANQVLPGLFCSLTCVLSFHFPYSPRAGFHCRP